jgi:hypothetical protein
MQPDDHAAGALQFLMIVNDGAIARHAATHGVSRLFVDLEHMGKDVRQGHVDSWKSRQVPADVSRIREAAPDAHLLVRINPLHSGSRNEIDDVLARGADSVMLPMFQGVDDLARFLDMLSGRAEALPLVETASALRAIPRMVETLPLSGLHIGLNDLHLDLGLDFMFQPMTEGLLEEPCAALREAAVPFGIGGVARPGQGLLPPEYVLGEHVRLGSSAAILSRSFHGGASTLDELVAAEFAPNLRRLQTIYRDFLVATPEALEQNRLATARIVEQVVARVRAARVAQ